MVNPTERRLYSEFEGVRYCNHSKSITELIIKDEILKPSQEIIYIIKFNKQIKKGKKIIINPIEIRCDNFYPFRPPYEIKINNKEYVGYVEMSKECKNFYFDRYGIQCLCCSSVICQNNWNVHSTLHDIVDEYIKLKKISEDYNNFSIIKNNYDQILSNDVWNYILDFVFDEDVKYKNEVLLSKSSKNK